MFDLSWINLKEERREETFSIDNHILMHARTTIRLEWPISYQRSLVSFLISQMSSSSLFYQRSFNPLYVRTHLFSLSRANMNLYFDDDKSKTTTTTTTKTRRREDDDQIDNSSENAGNKHRDAIVKSYLTELQMQCESD